MFANTFIYPHITEDVRALEQTERHVNEHIDDAFHRIQDFHIYTYIYIYVCISMLFLNKALPGMEIVMSVYICIYTYICPRLCMYIYIYICVCRCL